MSKRIGVFARAIRRRGPSRRNGGHAAGRLRMAVFAVATILWLPTASLVGQRIATKAACDSAATFKQADALLKQKQYDQAQSILGTLYSCHNLSSLETFNLGWLYGRAHNFQKALEIFQSVGPDVPDPRTHQYAIGLGHFELRDYKAAAETLKGLEAQGPLDPDSANLLGVSYSKLGRYQDAYAVFADEIHRQPADQFAYFNLITLLADAGQFAEAVKVASLAAAAFPGNPDVLVVRGAAHSLLGETSAARDDFAAAVRLAPEKASSHFLLALSDYKQGEYAVSANELKTAIQAGVVDSDLHYLLAECLLKLNPAKADAAIAELDRAIALDNTSVSARTLRGKLLMEEGRAKDAAIDLQVAHRADPGFRSATYNLARVDMALGKGEEARQLYGQLSKQPADAVGELGDRKLKEAFAAGTMQ
jgi:tetratricopeptide (TPR) repeat protein